MDRKQAEKKVLEDLLPDSTPEYRERFAKAVREMSNVRNRPGFAADPADPNFKIHMLLVRMVQNSENVMDLLDLEIDRLVGEGK